MRIGSICGLAMCGMMATLAGCSVDASEPHDEASNASPITIATAEPVDEERLTEAPAEVTFAWDVPNDGSVVQTQKTSVGVLVTNATKAPLTVRLVVRGDDGGTNVQQLPIGTLTLAAGSREPVTLDLARLRFDLPSLRFAGSIQLYAHVDGADGASHESVVSDALYFHPVTDATGASSLAIYGGEALKTRFAKGDFRGEFRGVESDPEASAMLRVVDFGGTLAAPEPAPSAATNMYKTCISFQVHTIDSGIKIANGPNAGGVEDYGAGWNTPTALTAYGAKIRLKRGTWQKEFIADPVTGCVSWSHADKGPFELRVYAYASNGKASVRTHDNPNDFSDTPGNNHFVMGSYSPTVGSTQGDQLTAWDEQGIFTMTGVVGFGLRRLSPYSVAGTRFDMALDTAKDGWSSAHWGKSNSYITQKHHYIKILNTQARRKFLVAHEFGHAYAAIDYGRRSGAKNGGEPNCDWGYGTFSPFQLVCQEGKEYSINSNEWASIGFREGFAHFVASVIFNNQHPEGSFHWLGSHHDLERYGNGAGDKAGGYYENTCCFDADCPSTGTIEDWLLFFWDYYTNTSDSCTAQPTFGDMLALYSKTRLNGGLTKDNYFTKMKAAAKENANLPTCLKEGRFTSYASWNGIDN